MRLLNIVGARPQFIKLAPVNRAFASLSETSEHGLIVETLHTGQHYDDMMSAVFFEQLQIPAPSIHLKVGSGNHGKQTALMLEGIESKLLESRPDVVVIYGDTNSTVAGALAASKIHIPVVHIEAGLRSFDRRMPEEINRLVADHTSDLLLAPTHTAMNNLKKEGLDDRSIYVGDVMLDALQLFEKQAGTLSTKLQQLDMLSEPFALVTVHRPSNTEADTLRVLLDSLNHIATKKIPILFPMHPRTRAAIDALEPAWKAANELHIVDPVGYFDIVQLLHRARVVLTDSGGLQKEAFFAGVDCVTLRDTTEWTETISLGGNQLVGTDSSAIESAIDTVLSKPPLRQTAGHKQGLEHFGSGNASELIAKAIISRFGKTITEPKTW